LSATLENGGWRWNCATCPLPACFSTAVLRTACRGATRWKVVAGLRVARRSPGYEPGVKLLHHPAIWRFRRKEGQELEGAAPSAPRDLRRRASSPRAATKRRPPRGSVTLRDNGMAQSGCHITAINFILLHFEDDLAHEGNLRDHFGGSKFAFLPSKRVADGIRTHSDRFTACHAD